MTRVRHRDRDAVARDLPFDRARNREESESVPAAWPETRGPIHPRVVRNFNAHQDALFRFFNGRGLAPAAYGYPQRAGTVGGRMVGAIPSDGHDPESRSIRNMIHSPVRSPERANVTTFPLGM